MSSNCQHCGEKEGKTSDEFLIQPCDCSQKRHVKCFLQVKGASCPDCGKKWKLNQVRFFTATAAFYAKSITDCLTFFPFDNIYPARGGEELLQRCNLGKALENAILYLQTDRVKQLVEEQFPIELKTSLIFHEFTIGDLSSGYRFKDNANAYHEIHKMILKGYPEQFKTFRLNIPQFYPEVFHCPGNKAAK